MSLLQTTTEYKNLSEDFIAKMLNWANQFNIFCLLQNNAPHTTTTEFDFIMGVSNETQHLSKYSELAYINKNKWYFGHISYDCTQYTEHINLATNSPHYFGEVFLFEPDAVLAFKNNTLCITATDAHNIWQAIEQQNPNTAITSKNIELKATLSKKAYIEKIEQIKKHLQQGDCYELNYCMEFYNETAEINPLAEYMELCAVSPTPFSALYKKEKQYLICASPERYICKTSDQIISQPIKGTIKRNLTDAAADEQLKNQLKQSQKEISENVMVVDLVRNDLSKICKPNTVEVPAYLQVYSFPQLHHLISTVQGQLNNDVSFKNILDATFPMGSMTGAPKHKVTQLINQYELSNRGIFSGTIGYIKPNGDFDFNVIIRSILYNAASQYLSYWVGSGITIYSNPADEYDECLLKAKAIEKTLS